MQFDVTTERILHAGTRLEFSLVPWDSEIFAFPVAQISAFEASSLDAASNALEAFERWRDHHEVRLASCRLRHEALKESMLLEQRGFRFIEMVYRPRLSNLRATHFPAGDINIERAEAGDLPSLTDVAGTAFRTGRYYLDWRLDPAMNDQRYRAWVRNSFADPRHEVLKAMLQGELVGFFIVEKTPDRGCYWHLTAVAPGWQGRGIGKALWQAMLLRHRDEGLERVDTTISAHNLPVLNLYAKLGFSFPHADTTFHWLRGPGPAGSGDV